MRLRSQPNTSAAQVGNLAEGTVVHPDCYTRGQNIGGTTLWWKVGGGYYTAFYDTMPLEWQDEIEQRYGIQDCAAPPPVPPDTDGDGFRDPSDGCPHVYVAANNGCPAKGDFSLDGKSDVAAFYRYDGNIVNLYVWYGQANLSMSGPHIVWTGNGWDGTRIIPVGVGDTDGDGKLDISTFYRHDGTMVDHNVWYGNGTGGFTLGRPWHKPSGWDGSRLIPLGVADLNSDGKADTIAIYDHPGDSVDMRAWYGTANRVGWPEPGGPWSESGWHGERITPAGTGDYNGDGKVDIAAFYNYDGQVVGTSIWYGNGAGTMNHFAAWYIDNSWEGERLIPTGIN